MRSQQDFHALQVDQNGSNGGRMGQVDAVLRIAHCGTHAGVVVDSSQTSDLNCHLISSDKPYRRHDVLEVYDILDAGVCELLAGDHVERTR